MANPRRCQRQLAYIHCTYPRTMAVRTHAIAPRIGRRNGATPLYDALTCSLTFARRMVDTISNVTKSSENRAPYKNENERKKQRGGTFARQWARVSSKQHRVRVKQVNAWQGQTAIGLGPLPHQVRRIHRVRLWVVRKMVIDHQLAQGNNHEPTIGPRITLAPSRCVRWSIMSVRDTCSG